MQLALQVRNNYKYVLESALWAEKNDLAAIALPDHYLERGANPDLPGYDHLVHLTALAVETSSIELVSLVSPVTFRHPAVLYKMAVTIDEISEGRFTLGVGTGWLEEEFTLFGLPYPSRSERFEMLEEAMEYLHVAIKPGPGSFLGKHYQLEQFDPHPHPIDLRLLIGGGGKVKTPRIAGRFSDEFNIYACPPEEFRQKSESAKEHARAVGRDPGTILLSTVSPALAASKKKDYRTLLEALAKKTDSTPDRIEEVYTERGYPHGHGSQPSEMLAALAEAGAERYYAQAFAAGVAQYEMIFEALGA